MKLSEDAERSSRQIDDAHMKTSIRNQKDRATVQSSSIIQIFGCVPPWSYYSSLRPSAVSPRNVACDSCVTRHNREKDPSIRPRLFVIRSTGLLNQPKKEFT